MSKSGIVHSLGKQEATSATSCEGWSQAADALRTPGTSRDERVLRDAPP